MSRSYRYPTSIRLSTNLKRRLAAQAKRRGHNVATLIAWVLERWVEAEEASEKSAQETKQ